MAETNGYVKWWQAVTAFLMLMAMMVTVGVFSANQAIAIDDRSNQRDQAISKTQQDNMEKIMGSLQEIALDVRELKVKIGVSNVKNGSGVA